MADNRAVGSAVGSVAGSFFGPLGSFAGGKIGEAIGGAFGGSNFKRPRGTIGTDQIIKLLGQGLSFEDIMAQGLPFVPRHQQRSIKKLTRAGLDPEQIAQLRNPGFAGGGVASAGPFGMQTFQSLLPAVLGNQALFSNPAAAGFLASLFPQSAPASPLPAPAPSPGLPRPFEGGLPLPGRVNPKLPPGPAPDPFTGLRGLVGPFGNGGGALVPQFGAVNRFRR